LSKSSTNKLVSKILGDADAQTQIILNEAKIFSTDLKQKREKEIKEKAETNCEKILNSAKIEAENIIRRETVNAKIKTRWNILSQKRNFVNEAFKKAEKQFESYVKKETYGAILNSLIIEAVVAAGGGKLEILMNEKDAKRKLPVKEISKEVSSKLSTNVDIIISKKKIKTVGGVIIQTADGKTKIDNTLEALLTRKRKDLEPKISEVLFRESTKK
jgi:V/A-type H+-transporting ATPase subunit E